MKCPGLFFFLSVIKYPRLDNVYRKEINLDSRLEDKGLGVIGRVSRLCCNMLERRIGKCVFSEGMHA